MGYIDSSLLPGEAVVARARLHRVVFAKAALVAVVGLIALYLSATRDDVSVIVGGVILVVALAMAIPPLVTSMTSEFGVTDKRVVIKVGMIRRRTVELLLRQIEAISVDQTVTGRMLNYGTITLTGTGGVKEEFHNIARPLEFRRAVHGQSVKDDAASASSSTAARPSPERSR